MLALFHLIALVGPYFGYAALLITSGMFVRHSYLINALRLADENVSRHSSALALAEKTNEDMAEQLVALRQQVAELSAKIDRYQQVIADQASENLVLQRAVAANNLLTQQATLANTLLLQHAGAAEAALQQRAALVAEQLRTQAAVVADPSHTTP